MTYRVIDGAASVQRGEVTNAAASDAPKAGGSVRLPTRGAEDRKVVSVPQPVAPGEGTQSWGRRKTEAA